MLKALRKEKEESPMIVHEGDIVLARRFPARTFGFATVTVSQVYMHDGTGTARIGVHPLIGNEALGPLKGIMREDGSAILTPLLPNENKFRDTIVQLRTLNQLARWRLALGKRLLGW